MRGLQDEWYVCDDDSVRLARKSDILSSEAYILFYKLDDGTSPLPAAADAASACGQPGGGLESTGKHCPTDMCDEHCTASSASCSHPGPAKRANVGVGPVSCAALTAEEATPMVADDGAVGAAGSAAGDGAGHGPATAVVLHAAGLPDSIAASLVESAISHALFNVSSTSPTSAPLDV